VPTTYAGSEATNVWGLTGPAGKRTGSDDRVLPETVVYDPDLVASLPPELAAASGLNAVAHCVDALWGPHCDPIDEALAGEGLRALNDGLRAGIPARIQYGCYLAAVAFASAGSGLHHRICHVLGGRFGLPHAATHAIVLPYVVAYNAVAAPDAADGSRPRWARSTRWPASRTCGRRWMRRSRCGTSACGSRTCRRRSTRCCPRSRRATPARSTPTRWPGCSGRRGRAPTRPRSRRPGAGDERAGGRAA
jgi:hypothetical protein